MKPGKREACLLLIGMLFCWTSVFAEPRLQPDQGIQSNTETLFPEKITLRDGRIIYFSPNLLSRLNTKEALKNEESSPIVSRTLGNDTKETIVTAKDRGAASALNDIKSGRLRILVSADLIYNWKVFQMRVFPYIDDATGFPAQIVGHSLITQGCCVSKAFVAEVEAYNQVMCSWSKAQKTETPQK